MCLPVGLPRHSDLQLIRLRQRWDHKAMAPMLKAGIYTAQMPDRSGSSRLGLCAKLGAARSGTAFTNVVERAWTAWFPVGRLRAPAPAPPGRTRWMYGLISSWQEQWRTFTKNRARRFPAAVEPNSGTSLTRPDAARGLARQFGVEPDVGGRPSRRPIGPRAVASRPRGLRAQPSAAPYFSFPQRRRLEGAGLRGALGPASRNLDGCASPSF